ncbi:uncharacterized protein LOC133913300 isoform X1 [Phragmites australis]|uniref:uncharacterized protein LOC133913300 isoform X1 n=1 Tax=Phragmites australis TaxID=29695 RepID=UPI002D7659CD|nr:uncharacterized protein LOC133913300 isoform X1 [Phragmites australis]
MPSPPPSMSPFNKCCRCCSSSSPPPPRPQRAAEIKQPICGGARVLITTRRAHAASLLLGLVGAAVSAPAARVRAEEENGGEEGVLGAIKSIFDPNEKTKAGKVLPKAYLKASREVVRTLRESLEEDGGGDIAKFRRNADAAKESIREFLGGWRGQQVVAAEVIDHLLHACDSRSRTLRWRRRSDHWRSSTPKQDLSLRFHRMSRIRSWRTSTPQRPACSILPFAALYCIVILRGK